METRVDHRKNPSSELYKGVGNTATGWFDVKDLAKRYKTSVRHIYRMCDCGKMPWGVKLGQLRRWPAQVIEFWEASGCPPDRPVGEEDEAHTRQRHE